MVSLDHTRVRRNRIAAIAAAAVGTALALASAVPMWAQAPPTPSTAGECTPGQIVDFCRDVPPGHGFLRDKKGVFTTIDVPGASLTVVFDSNNRGQMVGAYIDAGGPTPGGFTHGFLFDAGAFTTIDVPGPLETEILVNSAAAPALRASTYPRRTSAGPSADRCRHRAARGRTISRASTPRIVHFVQARPRARHFGPEVIPPGSTLRI
jgi:hypothetical protein